MRPIVDAGLYLLSRSLWNRGRRAIARLRHPRYALALLVGVAYLTLVLWGQRAQNGAPVPVPAMQLSGTLLLALLAAKWWIFGADRLALAFTPAELQFLFPAPVTRMGLLGYKLLRAQLLLLVNVVIWLLLLNRGRNPALPLGAHALTLWVMFTTMFLHRLGVALTRDSLMEHGRAGVRRQWPAILGLLALGAVIIVSVRRTAAPFDDAGTWSSIGRVFETAPLSWVLFPFRIPFLPLAAPDLATWAPRFLAAVGLALLHLWWVIRADHAFEEAAIEASARRAELMERWRRQGSRPRAPARGSWGVGRLAPTGHPVSAIIWKNLTRLMRTASPGVAFSTVGLLGVILAFTLLAGEDHLEVTVMIGTLALGWVLVLVLFGPQWVRNDLRGELEHLPVLRTWPVSGVILMTGQVLSSALVLTATQGVLAIVGLAALTQTTQIQVPGSTVAVLFLPGLVVLGALNFVALSIQNAGALLYPSWVRTEIRPAGIEAMGQHLLTAGISFLLLVLSAAGPVGLGGAAAWALWDRLAWWSLLPAFLVSGAAFVLEGFLLIDWMGGRFEALDITPAE
ncbi:MAG TPA: putative ABC exporter domain-containing protein [Gemmatimonadales bacterium]|nr:putative ABC exporter domain-containing protein [Gemmatimonadales bacterium]